MRWPLVAGLGLVVALAVAAAVLLLGRDDPLVKVDLPPLASLPVLEADGYGAAAVGGRGGPERVVTNLDDEGAGSLRDALFEPGPAVIRFGVSGRIRLRTELRVPSDVTLDGRVADVTVTGRGLTLSGVENVIIVDLTFTDGDGDSTDAIRVNEGTTDVWIDHCDLSDYPDGLIDITLGASDVTVSWSRFTDHDKVMLINDEADPGVPVRVTLHHNNFDGTGQRNPLVRWATVHAYDNVVSRWHLYGMRTTKGGQLLSQANMFVPFKKLTAVETHGDTGAGHVRSEGDLALGGSIVEQSHPEEVFDPSADYSVTVEPASRALMARITKAAGPRNSAARARRQGSSG